MQLQDERTGFARADLTAMPALEDAPELYRPAPAPDDPLTRQDARRDEDFALRAAAQATALTRLLSAGPPEGDPDGFAARQLTRFDDESAALLDGAPSPRAEEAARAAISRARGRFADWTLPQEAVAQTVARRQNLINTLAEFRASAEQDPDSADFFRAEGDDAIRGAVGWLGEQEMWQLRGQWQEELYGSVAKAQIYAAPEQSLNQLVAGAYADKISPDRHSALINEARNLSSVSAKDRLAQEEEAARRTEITRAQESEIFTGKFLQALKDGTANRRTIEEAIEQRRISPTQANRLVMRLDEKQIENRERFAAIRRVTTYIDGESDDPPNESDVETHFTEVLWPFLEGLELSDRIATIQQYRREVGFLPEAARIALGEEFSEDEGEESTSPINSFLLSRISAIADSEPGPPSTTSDPKLKPIAEFITGLTPGIGEFLSGRQAIDLTQKGLEARRRGDQEAAKRYFFEASVAAVGAIPIFGTLKRAGKTAENALDVLTKLAGTRADSLNLPPDLLEKVNAAQREMHDAQKRLHAAPAGSAERRAADKDIKRSSIKANHPTGKHYESQSARELEERGFEVERREVPMITPDGKRTRFDLIVKFNGRPIAYVETKARDGLYAYSEGQTRHQMQVIRSQRGENKMHLIVMEAGGIIKVYTPEGKWIKGYEPPIQQIKLLKPNS